VWVVGVRVGWRVGHFLGELIIDLGFEVIGVIVVRGLVLVILKNVLEVLVRLLLVA
jgi:hypothetical protein